MKSKRAEEFINNSSELIDGLEWMVDASTARRAVELAEQDAEEQYQDDLHHYQLMMNDTCSEMIDERDEEITRYRKELEESKRREELARKVIDDQRKKIKALKARAVCAFDSLDFTEFMTAECVQDFDNVKFRLRGLFIQKLNERRTILKNAKKE